MNLTSIIPFEWSLGLPFILGYGLILAVTLVLLLIESGTIRHLVYLRFLLCLLSVSLALTFTGWAWLRGVSFEYGFFLFDRFSLAFALILLVGLWLWCSQNRGSPESDHHEAYAPFFLSACGVLAVIHTNDFVALYLGLELSLVPLLLGISRGLRGWHSSEVLTKFFLSAGLGSLCVLVGITSLYIATGQTELAPAMAKVSSSAFQPLQYLGFIFLLVGLAIKMGWVPLHFAAIDIWDRGQTPVVSWYAFITQLTGIVILSRLLVEGWNVLDTYGNVFLIGAAVLAAIVGPLQSLQQSTLKRRLAYGRLGELGFFLLAIAAAGVKPAVQEESFVAVLVYMFVYTLLIFGYYALLQALARRGEAPLEVHDLAGLAKTRPGLSAAFVIILLSWAGFPFTAGFMSKYYLLQAPLGAGLVLPACLLLFAWGLSIYNAIDIIKVMYFSTPRNESHVPSGYPLLAVIFITAFLNLYWGVLPQTLFRVMGESIRVLLY